MKRAYFSPDSKIKGDYGRAYYVVKNFQLIEWFLACEEFNF